MVVGGSRRLNNRRRCLRRDTALYYGARVYGLHNSGDRLGTLLLAHLDFRWGEIATEFVKSLTTSMNTQTISQLVELAVVSVLAGCTSTPSHWEDVTRNGRGRAEFTMDLGQCQLVSQDVSYREQSVNQAEGCAGTAGCATLGVFQGFAAAASNDALNACMNAHGWIFISDPVPSKQAAISGAPAPATPNASVNANNAYAAPTVAPREAKPNKPIRVLASSPAVFGVTTAAMPERNGGLEGVDGAMVTAVAPNSSAMEAGIRVGDIILRVNGQPINDPDDVRTALANAVAGSIVEIRLMRAAKPVWVHVQF